MLSSMETASRLIYLVRHSSALTIQWAARAQAHKC